MRNAFLVTLALALPLAARAESPASPRPQFQMASYSAPAPVVSAPQSDVSLLLDIASANENSPARQAARNELFHDVVPRIQRIGRPVADAEARDMVSGLAGFPCAAGLLRVSGGRVLGDAARVQVAGGEGGCSVLMRRDAAGWSLVMVLGWTLAT